ncbi:TetR family transcriptional regulator C-terminal domain-containing protein [Streptomyces sp. G6]|uniref:TetR family transcriptional regulator C-terminal domain-containing protein n=1 Tax=Streptomyces sp. G6 TaxID=1178736 RepID=UPI003EDB05C4
MRALERYVATTGARQASILADDALPGAERLRALIDVVVDEELQAASRDHAAGCMVVQSFMSPDLRERDERVAQILDRDLHERLSLLSGAIRAGRIDGSITEGIDPDDGAALVSTLISGLRVTAQAGVDTEILRRIALAGMSSLLD